MSTEILNIEEKKVLAPKLRFREFEKEWESKKFGEIVTNKSGKFNPIKENHFTKCIELEHLSQETGKLLGFIDGSNSGSIKNKFIEGDVLFGKLRPYLKKYLHASFNGVCSSEIWVLKGLKITNPYLYQIVQSDKFVDLANQSSGSKMPRADWNVVENGIFSIPTLPEQQKIAFFLSAVDEKIQQLSRKKELLEQYKKGVMQQLFSGKLRFKDENGEDYPDWEEKKLGDVCTNISYGMNAAATTYDGTNKYLRITDIDESSNGLNLDKPTSPNAILEDKFRVKEGDLLFARTGASVGKSYLYRNTDGILYFAGFLIRFHIKKAIPAFVYLQTQTSKYDKWVKVMSMRSGQPGINAEEYKTLEMTFPSLPEQQKIANFLSSIDTKIETVNGEIGKAQLFKKGLLQQMFV